MATNTTRHLKPSYLLWKVLDNDYRSPHGNADFAYELPKDGEPGAWTEPVTNPVACERGYHLTSRPTSWWVSGGRLFAAEARGVMRFHGDKVACESVRLVEEVTPEWQYLPLFPEIRALLYSTWRLHNPDADRPIWAYLSGANLSRATLSGATLSGAYLSGADLSGAGLSRADLSRANLSGADLSGADLSRATLSRANLSRADLSRADHLALPSGWELDEYGRARRKVAPAPVVETSS